MQILDYIKKNVILLITYSANESHIIETVKSAYLLTLCTLKNFYKI